MISFHLENKICNLLLLTNGDKQHFVRITYFSRLLRKQGDNVTKRYYYTQCLDGSFGTEEALHNHQEEGSTLSCITKKGWRTRSQ